MLQEQLKPVELKKKLKIPQFPKFMKTSYGRINW
jgi:hypothetical protein